MDDVKKTYREGADTVRKAARDVDGHDLGDEVADLGDDLRTKLAGAGDDLRREARDANKGTEVSRSPAG